MNKNVFVFCEQRDGEIQKVAFELVGKARELADALGQEVVAVLAGSNIEGKAASLIAHGADKVIVADDPMLAEYSTKPYTEVMEKVIADTVHIYRLMNLPKAAELPPEAVDGLEACVKEHGAALITGALTDTMVLPLLRSGVLRRCRLVVKDPSKVLLSADTLDKLVTREVALETEEAARTLCITVNPVSAYGWKFDKDEFLHRMREAVDVPVINVKEELA